MKGQVELLHFYQTAAQKIQVQLTLKNFSIRFKYGRLIFSISYTSDYCLISVTVVVFLRSYALASCKSSWFIGRRSAIHLVIRVSAKEMHCGRLHCRRYLGRFFTRHNIHVPSGSFRRASQRSSTSICITLLQDSLRASASFAIYPSAA